MKQTVKTVVMAILLFGLLPMFVVVFASSLPNHLDMGLIVIALLVINPLFFATMGWNIPSNNKITWVIPILYVAIFFVCAYLIYHMNDWFYVWYYLMIAYLSAFVHIFVLRKKQK